eukprot:1145058-Pelagomonas_calceolata.AAC.4
MVIEALDKSPVEQAWVHDAHLRTCQARTSTAVRDCRAGLQAHKCALGAPWAVLWMQQLLLLLEAAAAVGGAGQGWGGHARSLAMEGVQVAEVEGLRG